MAVSGGFWTCAGARGLAISNTYDRSSLSSLPRFGLDGAPLEVALGNVWQTPLGLSTGRRPPLSQVKSLNGSKRR
jgi:hypothetical protein